MLALLLASTCLQDASWYKGNTHAHTLWDDGDALPEAVAGWYRSRGYHFLVLSDHNERNAMSGRERSITVDGVATRLKPLEELQRDFDKPGSFMLVPGQEIGDSFRGKLVHHAVVNSGRILMPPGGTSLRETLEHALYDVAGEGDRLKRPVLAQLSHPNLGWTVSADDLAAV
ncbi:MAG TPA: hypothetical protein VE981_09520, partial [Planctomycetota bacterium]|nr:hypothetical protein [Planctomycetota bacterium]